MRNQSNRSNSEQDFLRETNRIAGTIWVILGSAIGWAAILIIWRAL